MANEFTVASKQQRVEGYRNALTKAKGLNMTPLLSCPATLVQKIFIKVAETLLSLKGTNPLRSFAF